jgi:hypothetical protein
MEQLILIIALLMATVIGSAQFFSERFSKFYRPYYNQTISLSAGISVTYIFLELFPTFSERAVNLNEYLFISPLVGFIIFHFFEKHVYHHYEKKVIKKELLIEGILISFIYHIILGIIIFNFLNESIEKGLLLFFPILIFTVVSILSFNRVISIKINLLLSFSTLIGVIIALFIFSIIDNYVLTFLIGFLNGVLMFSVFRHSLPWGREGKPLFFILGIILYSPLIILSWSI